MIVTSQVTVAGTAVTIGTVPAGASSVVITNAGAATLFVGAGGTAVTAANGAPLPASGVIPLPGFPSSASVKLWGLTSGGTVTAGLFISNAN